MSSCCPPILSSQFAPFLKWRVTQTTRDRELPVASGTQVVIGWDVDLNPSWLHNPNRWACKIESGFCSPKPKNEQNPKAKKNKTLDPRTVKVDTYRRHQAQLVSESGARRLPEKRKQPSASKVGCTKIRISMLALENHSHFGVLLGRRAHLRIHG